MNNVNQSSLQQQIDQLPKERLPERDLWAGIEHSISGSVQSTNIESKNKSVFKPIYGLAASVTLVALVGYFSFQGGVASNSFELVEQMSQQHLEHRDSLLVSLKDQPTTTQNWQQQLNELDDAAAAIRLALENDPNNTALLKMLKRVHQQQIALIERVHAPAWQRI